MSGAHRRARLDPAGHIERHLGEEPVPEAQAAVSLPARGDGTAIEVLPGDDDASDRVDGWLREYARTHDAGLRERIIVAYLGLADRLAGRFRGSRSLSHDDLVQTARMGLVAAVDRYDPDRGSRFVPYAVACVVGELKRSLRDTSWRLHVSRPAKELALRLCRLLDELPQSLMRSPTMEELAERLGVSMEETIEAVEVAQTRFSLSLDQPAGEDGQTPLRELLPTDEPAEALDDLLVLPDLINRLPRLEREVVVLRFFHDLNQERIAERVGCSQMHVSRLLRRAIGRLRARLLAA
jgi:RNA polymerase sigma-B factor